MTEQEDTGKKSQRDLLLVLLILPLGVLCMFMTGQAAIRLAPKWVLPADMLSLLDPNAEFAGGKPFSIQPLDPNILTLPAWGDLFLTPHVIIPTRILPTSTPQPPVRTPPPPVVNTPDEDPEPTATLLLPPNPSPPPDKPQADLRIEKSDNSRTYTPGTSIDYTILVTNLGPETAPKFNVIDNLPEVIKVLSINCTPANLCGSNTSSGNTISFTGAWLPFGGGDKLTITVNAMIASSATGDLANTAKIDIPKDSKFYDPISSNNTVTDTDTQLSIYDLAITKSDGVDTYTAADPINYTIVVTNSGPSDAIRIKVRDALPRQIASWTWVCTAATKARGCNGVTDSTSDFVDVVTVRVGGRIEYSVTANPALLPQNPRNLSNTARIILPSGSNHVDPDLSNNSATDVNSPGGIDLQITKTDVPPGDTYTPGGPLSYSVTVTNASSFNLTGVSVTDALSPMLSTWTWSCTPGPGASCSPGATDTNINDAAVSLPPGGSVTYQIDATVQDLAAGTLENTATVDPPAGLVDVDLGNNTAADSNSSTGPSQPNIGPGDGTWVNPPEGGPPIVLVFGPPIIADGDIGEPDFVYYERIEPRIANPQVVAMDWVKIEISTDGVHWTQVFYWGDSNPGIPDTNTNVDYVNVINDLCTAELDNCRIPLTRLYNQTGITIDIDPVFGITQGASYSWIRITAPVSTGGDSPDVDAIQPYYP